MDQINESLDKIGLSDYETRVYHCLLQKNQLTATELARITQIPNSKIYAILAKLEKKHFCTRVPGNEKRYKAIIPSNPIAKQISSLKRQIDDLENIAGVLDSYFQSFNHNDNPVDYIEVIRDRDLILLRTEQLEAAASSMIRCMLKSPFILNSEALIREGLGGFTPGVRYISIYDEQELGDSQLARIMRMYAEQGVEVRVCPNIPVKFAIFDDNTVLINTRDMISNSSTSTAIIVHHEDLARAFSDLFEFYYHRSTLLETR